MAKSKKELAFLFDLHLSEVWGPRFTKLFDENLGFEKGEKILYLNAGTGQHLLELYEKFGEKAEISAACENEHLLKIAKAKAEVMKAKVTFFEGEPRGIFDTVLVDAMMAEAGEIDGLIAKAAKLAKNSAAFLAPTAGSYGEIFSFLWEVLLNEGLLEHSAEIEKMISEIPTLSNLKDKFRALGFKGIESKSSIEVFEYKDGSEFIESGLIADFLLPRWLKFLSQKQSKSAFRGLEGLINAEEGALSFRFSVKAAMVSGQK